MTYDEAQAAAALEADTSRRPHVVHRHGRGFAVTLLDLFAAVYNGPGQPHKLLHWIEWPANYRPDLGDGQH